ncbi:MAG TPA: DUF5689 domain-containing protein [Candidatus Cloacimonadota bacterium]|nr:DUF5689 domain-containing protein [Candidatus Cloacimonadota bacterium]
MKKAYVFLLTALITLLVGSLSATLLLEDNFTGEVGTLLTANGWTAHSSAGSTPMSIASPGLVYNGYASSGIGNATSASGNGEDVYKAFTSVSSGSVYFSFLINTAITTTTAGYSIHLGNPVGTTNNFYARFWLVKNGANANFGLSKANNTVNYVGGATPTAYSLDTTYLIVIKYTFNSGTTTDDVVSMWVNPALGGSEPTPDVTVTESASTDAAALAEICIRQWNAGTLARFDGIRVGTTWEDVCPPAGYTGEIIITQSLTPFSTTVGTPSSAQTYQVEGSNLTSSWIDINVTSGPFQIADANNPNYWVTSLEVPIEGSNDILVRYNPTEEGTHNGTIVHSVDDNEAAPQTVYVSGTATNPNPVIDVTPSSLSFYTKVGETSAPQMVTVVGSNLTQAITVASTGPYTFSNASGGTYSNPYYISSGYNGSNDIYVKFSPTAITTYTNPITFTSGTASDEVAVTGVGLDPSEAYATDLFISEYVEGTSNNKYLEIFNGTGAAVDLSNYKLQLFANGAAIGSPTQNITLSGTLNNGSCIVYKNSLASLTLPEGVEAINNAAVNFNGDDAVALYKISTASYVDIFGRIGEQPSGGAWGTSPLITKDATLIRKSNVIGGVTVNPTSGFPTLATEWDGYATNYVDNLGTHTFAPGLSPAEAPVISPAGGLCTSPVNVTMSTTTPGGVIWYTLDGSDPTNEAPSIQYTGSFVISATTTVKAKTYASGYSPSAIASVTYIFPVPVNNIAALRAMTPGTGAYYKLTGEAVVTMKGTGSNYKAIYIQDASGAIMIYDLNPGIITTTYNRGDGITGIVGTLSLYNNMLEFTPSIDPGAPTSTGNTVEPVTVTFANLTSDYQAKLVRIENVSFSTTGTFTAATNYNVTDPSGSGVIRTQYTDLDYLGTDIPSSPTTIVGVILQYQTTMQFIPRSLADFSTGLETPVTAIYLDNGNVALTWNAVSGATSYKVYGSDDPYATFPDNWTLLYTGSNLSYPYSGGAAYHFFKVTANN